MPKQRCKPKNTNSTLKAINGLTLLLSLLLYLFVPNNLFASNQQQKLQVCINLTDSSLPNQVNQCTNYLKQLKEDENVDDLPMLMLGEAHYKLAQNQILHHNDSLAEHSLLSAIDYFESVESNTQVSASLIKLADVSKRLFKTKLQLKYLYKALVINEALGVTENLLANYLQIAQYYLDDDNLFLAKLFLQKAYGVNQDEVKSKQVCQTKLMDANINIEDKKYLEAERLLDEISLEAFRKNDNNLLGKVAMAKGKLNDKIEETELAIYEYNQAFKKFVKTQNNLLKTQSLVKLVELFIQTQNFDKAGKGIERLSKLYKHDVVLEHKFYMLASEYYEAQNNNELALTYYKKAASVNQLIRDKKAQAKLSEMSLLNKELDSENQAQTNAIIKQEQASANKYQGYFTVALMFLAFTLSVLAWMWYRQAKASKINASKFEKAVEQRTAQLKIANKKLRKSNQRLEQFAYVASHDLKSPIRTVIGFLSLAKKNMPAEAYQAIGENIDIAIGSCKKMSHIIEDVLEYSRLQQDASNKRFVDLNQTIEIVKGHLHELIDQKNGSLQTDVLPGIYANSNQILQVFQNLIENAFKYNESQLPYVKVEYWEGEEYHNFAVEDNGIGFDTDLTEKAFTMFQRLNSARNYEGTGIGLAIVKEVIELHGGFITVVSEEGYGSRFEFCLRKSKNANFTEAIPEKKQVLSRRLVS